MFKKFIDIFALVFISSLTKLIAILPKKLGLGICLAIIKLVYKQMPRSKDVAIKNIETCLPDIKDPEKLYWDSASILAENLYTFCLLPKITKEYIEENIDYSEFKQVATELSKSHKSVLAVTAHFGMFELAAFLCPLLGFPVNILARDLKLPRVDKWWNDIREKNGNKIFSRKGAYKKTFSYLKKGEHVAMLCDQNVKRRHAVFADFFGINASSAITIGHAVSKTKCALMFTVLAKKKDGKYKFIGKKIDTNFETDDLNEFARLVMRSYHIELENVIREYPDHWFWIHRRFKTTPEGVKEDFYD